MLFPVVPIVSKTISKGFDDALEKILFVDQLPPRKFYPLLQYNPKTADPHRHDHFEHPSALH